MQLSLFDQPLQSDLLNDLFQAYFDARKNKRNTINALAFEINFEEKLFALATEIINCRYKPKPSICFVVNKPVKREIFAANFRDRVVHHLLFNYISPFFEKVFINDCYSCRKNKGTHYGIQRVDHFIRSCSENYTQDCYILKLDIKGYFMSINRQMLFEMVKRILINNRNKITFDFDLVLYLLKLVIFNDPTTNCIVKGKNTDWNDLPQSKSLFHVNSGCGLPIGNLTSQLFGNVYLSSFDHFVKRDLRIKYYGRYVDDFVLIHENIEYLKSLIPIISSYLTEELQLELHPKKIYLQHFSKGVKYLGAVVKPHRISVANRTKGNFYEAVEIQNRLARNHKPSAEERKVFVSSMNSYLGIMKHYKTHKIRKKIICKQLSGWWWNYITVKNSFGKFQLK